MSSSPGPWKWEPGDPTIEGLNGGAICHMAEHKSMHTIQARGEDFSSADARLIAAAPQLLEALKDRVDNCRDCSWMQVGEPERCRACARDAAIITHIEGTSGGGRGDG